MTDIFSKKKRNEIMSKVKNKDSKIEIMIRKALWHEGFRYRKNSAKYYGKPDIVMPKYKTVIFVDSCFWHYCPKHHSIPTTRKEFWQKKIESNRKRDNNVNSYYKKANLQVIRIWEHEIKNKKINLLLSKIIKLLVNC